MIRHYLTLLFAFSICCSVFGQEYSGYQRKETLPDSLIVVNGDTAGYVSYVVQPYAEALLELSDSPQGYLESFYFGGGIVWKNHWMIGLNATVFTADLQQAVIFPNNFSLSYMHGGGHIGYKTNKRGFFDLLFTQKVSFGEMSWQNIETGANVLASRFTIVQPAVGVDLNLSRFFKIHGNFGYRFVSGLDLAQAPNEDFQGPVFQLGIKAGLFNYVRYERND